MINCFLGALCYVGSCGGKDLLPLLPWYQVGKLQVFGGVAILNPGLTGVKMVLAGGCGIGAAGWGLSCIQV